MSDEKRRVLIVDDSPDDIHILMANLKQDYAVIAATSGGKALELAIKEPQPDVILMDVSMPDMDGYETCQHLKANPITQKIDVIFVSAHDTVEEKLSGYDAGGSDYLIKPVQPEELLQKVKQAIDNKDKRQEIGEAMKVAMTAISNAGEQGVVLEFMRRSFAVSSIEELARLVVESTRSYGLENSVQLRSPYQTINFSSSDPMPPLEKELLFRLKDTGRIKESGTRFIANFGNLSQLVKNMPEDEDLRGRLRDHLALLLEGAAARLTVLEMNQELLKLAESSKKALLDIQTMQKEQKEKAMQIMDNVMHNLEGTFLSYGLSEDQEEKLFNIVQAGVNESLDNFEKGIQIDEHMQAIISRLVNF